MVSIQTESLAMRFLKKIGLTSIAWSLRRLHCPVNKDDLVLEVGAGGNPYPRANVLLDAHETTIERIEKDIVKDRPLVFGLAEKLPFKDKSFDFIIASHVLEHSHDPESFLKELMRVGKAGYIETPDAFWERINPFIFHRLEVADINSKIRIYKKPSWRHGGEIVDLFERKLKSREFLKLMSKHPDPLYMRVFWINSIAYEIVNPEVEADWPIPAQYSNTHPDLELRMRVRLVILYIVRRLFSQTLRNKKINLFDLLICPTCGHGKLKTLNGAIGISCQKCQAFYTIKNGIPFMYPQTERVRKREA
jgi:uncharacterized protein YbaR (Trm112 family)